MEGEKEELNVELEDDILEKKAFEEVLKKWKSSLHSILSVQRDNYIAFNIHRMPEEEKSIASRKEDFGKGNSWQIFFRHEYYYLYRRCYLLSFSLSRCCVLFFKTAGR